MKKFDLYFYYVLGEREQYFDDGKGPYLYESSVLVDKEPYIINLITDQEGISMIRIKKEGLLEDKINNTEYDQINLLKEHILNSINLYFNPTLRIRFDMYSFVDSNSDIDFKILMNKAKDGNIMCIKKFHNIFSNTLHLGNELKLIADAQKKYIPIQFRFLSLYKFLELEFKTDGKWNNSFKNFLDTIEPEFKKLGITNKKLSNYIHVIRDQCAHIKSNRDVIGLTSLTYAKSKEVEKFNEFLLIVCIKYINQIKLKGYDDKILYTANYLLDVEY